MTIKAVQFVPMNFDNDFGLIRETVLTTDTACAAVDFGIRRDALAELEKTAQTADRDQFLLAAMRVVALAGNGHTRVIPNAAISVLRLRVLALGGGFGVVDAMGEYSKFVGADIAAVNGMPVHRFMQRARQSLAGTRARQNVIGALHLTWPAAVRTIAGDGSSNDVHFDLRLPDGSAETLAPDSHDIVPALDLYPIWEHGQRHVKDTRPVVLCKRARNDAWYIALPTFNDPNGSQLEDALKVSATDIARDPSQNLIFDLRGNTGGDFTRTLPFMERVQQFWTGQKIAVLVDAFTFSAAIVFVALLKHRFTHAVEIVGEDMGDGLRFHAEGDMLDLPDSGAHLRFSTGWHDWETGVPTDETPVEVKPHMVGVGDLTPDHQVCRTAHDLVHGVDPQLARALAIT